MNPIQSVTTPLKKTFANTAGHVSRHKIISAFALLVLLIGGYFGYQKVFNLSSQTSYVLAAVQRGDIVSTVTGTGQVSGDQQVALKPIGSGAVVSVAVTEGQHVTAGQTLIVLDERSALVSLAQAKAGVETAQANYDKLINGNTSTDLAVSQISVQSAQANLSTELSNAYIQTDDLLKTTVNQFYQNPNSNTPQFSLSVSNGNNQSTFTSSDINQQLDLDSNLGTIKEMLASWRNEISASSSLDIAAQVADTQQNLSQMSDLLTELSAAVDTIYFQNSVYQSSINGYKSDVASARTMIQGLISSVASAQQALVSAQANYTNASAPPRSEDVESSKASLDSAKASLQSAQNNYDNNIVSAPFDGTVADIAVQRGDIPSGTVATLVADRKIAILPLNEIDAAKIALGDAATLTFDALPDIVASGTVSEIDSIGTVSQGVVDYNVKITINNSSDQIKPGMSISASIVSQEDPDTLIVPSSAVKTNETVSTVQVVDGIKLDLGPGNGNASSTRSFRFGARVGSSTSYGARQSAQQTLTGITPRTVPVQVGISNDTQTEILSGLSAGEVVVVRTISAGTQAAAATTAARPSTGGLLGGGGGVRRGGF